MTLTKRLATLERETAPQRFATEVREVDDEQWLVLLLYMSDRGVILPIEGELRQWAESFIAQAHTEKTKDKPEETKDNGGLVDATESEVSAMCTMIAWDGYKEVPPAYRLPGHRQKMLAFLSE